MKSFTLLNSFKKSIGLSFLLFLSLSLTLQTLEAQTTGTPPEGWIGLGGRISNLAEFRWFCEDYRAWDEDWVLDTNINAAETRTWNIIGSDTLGYIPIEKFTGSFNGNGYYIDSLYIHQHPDSVNGISGLFANTYDATISNLGLRNVDIYGDYIVGAFVGFAKGATTLESCYSTGVIVCPSAYVGGLVGFSGFDLNKCDIFSSYSSCQISGEGCIGGLIGQTWSDISDSYFFGSLNVNGSISRIGNITGLSANYTSQITHCYFDTTNSPDFPGIGSNDGNQIVRGIETSDFTNESVFPDWDFKNTWEIASIDEIDSVPRPYLKYQLHSFNTNYHNGEGGTIEGDTSQIINFGMDASPVTAIADEGKIFQFWENNVNDSIIYTEEIILQNIIEDQEWTAIFITPENSLQPSENDFSTLQIFPNPASDHVLIQTTNPGVLYLASGDGRLIMKKTIIQYNSEFELNINHLPTGLYYFRLIHQDRVEAKILVIE